MVVLQTNYTKTKQIQIMSNSSCTVKITTICSKWGGCWHLCILLYGRCQNI